MKLVIGGYAQGKLHYVLQKEGAPCAGFEGNLPERGQLEEALGQKKRVVINGFQCWVKECMLQNRCPEEELFSFLEKAPESVIISDEIGNGIVPMAAFERAYRERTGRILVMLAEQADEVVRVICGIGQKIK